MSILLIILYNNKIRGKYTNKLVLMLKIKFSKYIIYKAIKSNTLRSDIIGTKLC